MIYRVDGKLMFAPLWLVFFLFATYSNGVCSAGLTGTWRYEKSLDYFGTIRVPMPQFSMIQIVNSRAAFSSGCFVELVKRPYVYSNPFQSLLKEDVEEATLRKYLTRNLSFSIDGVTEYFEADADTDCNGSMRHFLVSRDRLLVPFSGSAFHSYVRMHGGAARSTDSKAPWGSRKLTQLPFNVASYIALCQGLLPHENGMPQSTEKCAPVYYPYIAVQGKSDALANLIGNHNYLQGGARYAEEYAPPFASKLHPTFVVLPPLNDILVVRVDDLEGGDGERDVMSGVYLTIRSGKVVDQLNESCSIDESYACIGDDGKKRYQLVESGKFKRLL